MHPNISAADRAVYNASAALDRLLTQAQVLRLALAGVRLPIPEAEDKLAYSDDLIAVILGQLYSAATVVNAEVERIQEAEEVAFARVHGLTALSEGQLVNRDFARWTNKLAANDDRASKAVL
jgi:hypothetical protein